MVGGLQISGSIHIDNKLDWGKNTDALHKRQLRSFNISRTMLRMSYESVVTSAELNAVVCEGSRLRVVDTNRLNILIRKSSDIVGVKPKALDNSGVRKENASQSESDPGQCVQPTP